jgi:lipoprotein-anchoring transpeptidase ErfK/SrfK
VGSSMSAQVAAAYDPPAGTFGFDGGYPSQLRSFWDEGSANTLDDGAITGFEAAHGLQTTGDANGQFWSDLLAAASDDQRNDNGYSYAIASQADPETLTIWHNGRQVFSSPANTGIPEAPTPIGTTPVYEKLPFQVMQGTNPDGSHYADPVEWVSYFNGGSAVHYFPRPGYGYRQSLGCVELPITTAETAYGYLPYGTLVTVTPG